MPHGVVQLAREWVYRLIGSFRVRARDAAFRDEIALHLELAEQQYRQRGYSPSEAARLARLRYGNADKTIEDLRRQQGIPWFGAFTLDVVLGLRMMRKFLGLTLIGGLAMTVGFTIMIAVFTYFDVVMWSDYFPLDDGERVIAIQVWDPTNGRRSEIAMEDFDRWRAGLRSFEDPGAFRTVERGIVHDNGEVEPIPVAEMSASGFDLARMRPLIGRTLSPDDEAESAQPVIVIGYDEWQSRFDGDADVIGRTLRLDDSFHTIVGVMPDDFSFPVNHRFWIPLKASQGGLISAPPAGTVFARLAMGVTLQEAQAELSATGLIPRPASAVSEEPLRLNVIHYPKNFVNDVEPADLASQARNARLLIFFVSLLLLPPCVNIAMLVYARMVTRKEEIALRTALGASRARIVLQLFIEMLVLSTLAAGFALVVVGWLVTTVKGVALNDLGRLPFWLDIGLSFDTVLFAAALAVFSACVIGLLPALRATSGYSRPGLSALDSRNRLRLGPIWTLLVIAQVAFSFAALPSAIELGWGVLRSHVLGPGFAAEQFLTARLAFDPADQDLPDAGFRARYDSARRALIDRVEADARVQSRVASSSAIPGEGAGARFQIDGDDELTGMMIGSRISIGTPRLRTIDIDERYLETYGIGILAGRRFEAGEFRSDSRSVMINATAAREYFPDANPLGRRISYLSPAAAQGASAGEAAAWYEIVGVIADRPAHPYTGSIFHPVNPARQIPGSIGFRVNQSDGRLREELRDLAARVDPALELQDIRTLEEVYDGQALGNYLGGLAIIVVSLSVLSLAAAGTYALMSFTVNQRRREIAIRMALGARPRKLLRGVLRSALQKLSIGAIAGIVLALLIQMLIPAKIVGGLEVPGVLPGAAALLVFLGLAASFAPARRALRTDPTECLSDFG